jgi:acetoin utilization deacetylase AcuC-like enzyme
MTLLLYDDLFLEHDTGSHPERAERLIEIRRHLEATGLWDRAVRLPARDATEDELARVHDPLYIEEIRAIAAQGGGAPDPDTVVCPRSFAAAVRAAGACCAAAEALAAGRDRTALALVRPPGHHALPYAAMGFCLFNNVAVAACHVQSACDRKRVFILDWDVHHGNGTQETFYDDADVLFCSIHRVPFYPGSGYAEDRGRGNGRGTTINIPLTADTPPNAYKRRLQETLDGPAAAFKPDAVLISAGFDTYARDPVGGLNLEPEDFLDLTRRVVAFARSAGNLPILSVLEGGYSLDGLPRCVAAHLEGLLEYA